MADDFGSPTAEPPLEITTGSVLFERGSGGQWRVGGVLAWLDDAGAIVDSSERSEGIVLVTADGALPHGSIDESRWGVAAPDLSIVMPGIEGWTVERVQARIAGIGGMRGYSGVLPLEGMMCRYCDPEQSLTSCPYFGNPHRN